MVACHFGKNRNSSGITKERHKGTDLEGIICSEKISSIEEALGALKKEYALHGCDTLIEVILLRANGETSFDLREAGKRLICNNHLKFLLTSWPDKTHQQRRSIKKGTINMSGCALTHVTARPPATSRIFRKADVIFWIEKFNELVHLGTAVCVDHAKELSSVKNLALMEKSGLPTEELCDDMEQELVDKSDPTYNVESRSAPSEDSEMDEECSEISDLMLAILSAMGEKRIVTRGSWHSISPPTRSHKLRVVTRLVEQACKTICPDGYQEMKKELIEKAQQSRTKEKDCFSSVMDSVAQRLAESNTREERIVVLSWIVDLPIFKSAKVLLTLPKVSKHTIHKARLYNRGGVDVDAKYIKVRYNPAAVDFFIAFLVRSNVLQTLPWIDNIAELSDGSRISLASTVRLQTYARIDRLYRSELKRLGKEEELWLSEGTVYRILNTLVPKMNRRMLCVDEFSVDAIQSWDSLASSVKEVSSMGHLDDTEQSDLIRRLRLARAFYECEYRNHLSSGSDISDHCTTFALSDKKSKQYRSECSHQHTKRCRQCVEAATISTMIVNKIITAIGKATAGSAEKYRLIRLKELAERSDRLLCQYRAHLVRGVVSDEAKLKYVESMENGFALITADWAMKVLPTGPLERQSSWFAKAGNSLHVSHILAKIKDQIDAASVASILTDVLPRLLSNGVSTVAIRSDNAGCFKSQSLLATLALKASSEPKLLEYSFSESQLGKGPSDRMAAHGKRKIRERVVGGKECTDCEHIFQALTGDEPVRATSTVHCQVNSSFTESTSIKEISKLFFFEFTAEGLTARKHFGIGEGQKIMMDKLNPINASLEIIAEGGFCEGDGFWVPLESADKTKKEQNKVIKEPLKTRLMPCSTPGCTKSFMTERRLEEHEILGKHKFIEPKETLRDRAIMTFSTAIETQESARNYLSQDSFSGDCMDYGNKPLEGWALKQSTRTVIPKASRDYAKDFFDRHRKMDPPRRASPRTLVKEMESAMKNGNYIFKVNELFNEKQLMGMFSRLEKQRLGKKNMELEATKTGKGRKEKTREVKMQTIEECDYEVDEFDFVKECIEEEREENGEIFD